MGWLDSCFFCCLSEHSQCVCDQPCGKNSVCGCTCDHGHCRITNFDLLWKQVALCLCLDFRCALPPTGEQPLLLGLYPWCKLYGNPP